MTASIDSRVEKGDTVPNFWLPDPTGEFLRFYRRFMGNAVVLFFHRSHADAVGVRELKGFIERNAAFEATGAHVVGVAVDSVESIAAFARGRALDLTLLADPKGAITAGFGVPGGAETGLATFIVDPNQRVLEVRRGGTGHAAWALAYVESLEKPSGPPPVISAQAPVLIVPDFFEPELCRRLIGYWEKDHAEGTVATGTLGSDEREAQIVDATLKSRLDCKPSREHDLELRRLTGRRIGPVLYKAFQFETAHVYGFQIGAYNDARQDYFRPHRDNVTKATQNRRFAMSVNLNDDYDGGCIRFAEWGGALYSPPAGGAIVFSCSLLHEALPVTRGTRFVALTFLSGPGDVQPGRGRETPGASQAPLP